MIDSAHATTPRGAFPDPARPHRRRRRRHVCRDARPAWPSPRPPSRSETPRRIPSSWRSATPPASRSRRATGKAPAAPAMWPTSSRASIRPLPGAGRPAVQQRHARGVPAGVGCAVRSPEAHHAPAPATTSTAPTGRRGTSTTSARPRTGRRATTRSTSASWHIVSLNSDICGDEPGCGPGTPQYEWLQADLRDSSDSACTLAIPAPPSLRLAAVSEVGR